MGETKFLGLILGLMVTPNRILGGYSLLPGRIQGESAWIRHILHVTS